MTRRYERTFSVSVAPERAWQAFTHPDELESWFLPQVTAFEPEPGGQVRYAIPGVAEVHGEVTEVEAQRRLRWTAGPGFLPGPTEITVSLEAIDTGTRITITQSGFGDGEEWLGELEAHNLGWDEVILNLVLYLERGVRFQRHGGWRVYLGVVVVAGRLGLEVARVEPGTFAHEVGLRPGDVLLGLGGAPLFGLRELWFFTREHGPGELAEVVWARGGQVLRARGTLGRRPQPESSAQAVATGT